MGSYNPVGLIPESYSDANLLSTSAQYSPTVSQSHPTSNEYRVTTQGYAGNHYESSGGVMVQLPMSIQPMNSSQNAAMQFAQNAVAQSAGGLPSDAFLSEVIAHRKTTSAGTTILAYSFIWRHSNNMLGGDMINATVDNVYQRTCTQYEYVSGVNGKPVKVCVQYQVTYPLRTSFIYRLWRSIDSSRRYPQSGSPTQSSLSVFQSVMANPLLKGDLSSLGSVVGYVPGYWSTDITSTDNTAYPAYHFVFSSGAVISADALTGAVYSVTQ